MSRSRTPDEQLDLFADPAPAVSNPTPTMQGSEQGDFADLSDDEIIAVLPRANLLTATALASQVISRDLGDRAVPALESLWRRFEGFGRDGPLPEQKAALATLGQIGTHDARAALSTMLHKRKPPDALLPLLLAAAVSARVSLSAHQLTDWLAHDNPEVRAPAFALACFAHTGRPDMLTDGLTDPYPAVRREAAIALGTLRQRSARDILLQELARAPTGRIVEALGAILDGDVIAHFRRCAQAHPELRTVIADELRGSDLPKAKRAIEDLAMSRS